MAAKHRSVNFLLPAHPHPDDIEHRRIALLKGFQGRLTDHSTVVIAHLGMNWTWLKKIAASMKPLRLWGGLLVGIAIIVVLIVLPVNNRRLPLNQGHGRIHETQE
jgi:hypothetical protein